MITLRIKKFITACLCLAFILFTGWRNLSLNLSPVFQKIEQFWSESGNPLGELPILVGELNAFLEENVVDKYTYVEGHGYVQRLLMKYEVNNFEVVRDQADNLHYTYFTTGPNPVDHLVKRLSRLQEAAHDSGAELIYLMTPDKFIPGLTQYNIGIPYNYANETADLFIAGLEDYQINYLDYRAVMQASGELTAESFYYTDHHWTIQMAFSAFQHLAAELEQNYGWTLKDADKLTDLSNYNQITYPKSYLGSMGRKTGQLYTKAEDFTVIYPKFDTDFHVYTQAGVYEEHVQGKFEYSLLKTSILRDGADKYAVQNDKFFTYMNGNPGAVQSTNLDYPEGPRVLFVKDSLIVPVASFLSIGTSHTTMIDPRYYHGKIEEVVKEGDYDFIFVTYTPQNLTDEFFPFYEED